MRLAVQHDRHGGVTLVVDRPSPALTLDQLATAIAAALTGAVTTGAVTTAAVRPRPPRRTRPATTTTPPTVAVDVAPVDVAPVDVAPVDGTAVDVVEDQAVEDLAGGERGAGEAGKAVIDPELDPEQELRREALRLLDEGLSDTAVCARLGISRGRLLRFDDPLTGDPETGDPQLDDAVWRDDAHAVLAGVTR